MIARIRLRMLSVHEDGGSATIRNRSELFISKLQHHIELITGGDQAARVLDMPVRPTLYAFVKSYVALAAGVLVVSEVLHHTAVAS